jgi:hypothetical protein
MLVVQWSHSTQYFCFLNILYTISFLKNIDKVWCGGWSGGVTPEFKPQYCKKHWQMQINFVNSETSPPHHPEFLKREWYNWQFLFVPVIHFYLPCSVGGRGGSKEPLSHTDSSLLWDASIWGGLSPGREASRKQVNFWGFICLDQMNIYWVICARHRASFWGWSNAKNRWSPCFHGTLGKWTYEAFLMR